MSITGEPYDGQGEAGEIIMEERILMNLIRGLAASHLHHEERSRAFKSLLLLSERQPEMLYDKWDHFAELLESEHDFARYPAVYILTSLAKIDRHNKFDRIFDRFYALLEDEAAARHIVMNSGRIARSKPHLRGQIAGRLLAIDATAHPPARKDLIKGLIIEAFGEFYEETQNNPRIIAFVRGQLDNPHPHTRKAAEAFLRKHAPVKA